MVSQQHIEELRLKDSVPPISTEEIHSDKEKAELGRRQIGSVFAGSISLKPEA